MEALHERRLADRLDLEWRHLTHHEPSVRVANSWGLLDDPIEDLDEVLVATGHGLDRPTSTSAAAGAPDDMLLRVVALAATGPLAARIVLQRVLPGLRHRARQWCVGTRRSSDDVLGDLVAVAWTLIRTYDVEARMGYVAANLIRDSAHYAFVAPQRRLSSGERATDPAELEDALPDRSTSSGELVLLLASARHDGVADEHIDLLAELMSVDGSTEIVARRHQVSSRMIRYRRRAAIAAIRTFLAATNEEPVAA